MCNIKCNGQVLSLNKKARLRIRIHHLPCKAHSPREDQKYSTTAKSLYKDAKYQRKPLPHRGWSFACLSYTGI